jgi:hypothetical protein
VLIPPPAFLYPHAPFFRFFLFRQQERQDPHLSTLLFRVVSLISVHVGSSLAGVVVWAMTRGSRGPQVPQHLLLLIYIDVLVRRPQDLALILVRVVGRVSLTLPIPILIWLPGRPPQKVESLFLQNLVHLRPRPRPDLLRIFRVEVDFCILYSLFDLDRADTL